MYRIELITNRSMKDKKLTSLEYVVLGLLSIKPQSGYDITNYFDEDMYSWSASPGSIYPMLKRLEKQDIIVGELDASDSRPRKVYSLTEEGEILLDEWLASTPRMRPFYEEREMALLRFQFMQYRFTISQTIKWVENYLQLVNMADSHRVSYAQATRDALEESGKSTVYNLLILEASEMDQQTLRNWLELARDRLQALAYRTGEFPAVNTDD